MMSPVTSIAVCLGEKYRCFAGRASRSEYWWFSLLAWLVCGYVLHTFPFRSLSATFCIVAVLAFAPPWLAATARRLHDIDRSGWWQAPALLILLLSILLLSRGGLLLALGAVLGLGVLLPACWYLSRPGSRGTNRFGEEPLV